MGGRGLGAQRPLGPRGKAFDRDPSTCIKCFPSLGLARLRWVPDGRHTLGEVGWLVGYYVIHYDVPSGCIYLLGFGCM